MQIHNSNKKIYLVVMNLNPIKHNVLGEIEDSTYSKCNVSEEILDQLDGIELIVDKITGEIVNQLWWM